MRLDLWLVHSRLFSSREKAREAVLTSRILVNDKAALRPAYVVKKNDRVQVLKDEFQYVSRSGKKLEAALAHFCVKVEGKSCLDIGSSTGGFTQCLLRQGAAEIFAVDVGENQMVSRVKGDSRVRLFEKTDIRDFNLPERKNVDLIVVDVSFISLRKIIPATAKFCLPKTELLLLFKPQFEVGPKHLKKGIYRDINIEALIKDFSGFLQAQNLPVEGVFEVPLKGKKGNQEYVIYSRSGIIIK